MKIRANFMHRLTSTPADDCRIERTVELSPEDFHRLQISPMQEQPFITENRNCMFDKDGVKHCLLALERGGPDGILIQATGPGYPCYAAYISGMKDILNAELSRAADFIVRQCMENSQKGNWQVFFNDRPGRAHGYVSCGELGERFGLTVQNGNGLDVMLLDTMRRRPAVTSVQLNDGIVETACGLGPQKQAGTQKTVSTGFSPDRAAELLKNAVFSALDLYRGEELYSMIHDSFGLTIREIREHGYLSDQELEGICHVPRQVLEGGMTVRDILALDGLPDGVSLAHKNSVFLVPVEDLKKLTVSGREDFAVLLDARVADIRVDEEVPELVLEGVEAAELERFYTELEAHEQAEQAMGPAMG